MPHIKPVTLIKAQTNTDFEYDQGTARLQAANTLMSTMLTFVLDMTRAKGKSAGQTPTTTQGTGTTTGA